MRRILKAMIGPAVCIWLVGSLASCLQGDPLREGVDYHHKTRDFFQKYVNGGSYDQQVAMTGKTKLVNSTYPIEIALFEDGQFYYMLEKLGDGHGRWAFEEKSGSLRLVASRDIFDMNIDVYGVEASGEQMKLGFYDRHGWNYIETKVER